MLKTICIGLAMLMLCSCATYYKEASSRDPHAVLSLEKGSGISGIIGATTATVLEINGKPPNEWTKLSFAKFRVHPGNVSVLLHIPGKQVEGVTHLRINAVAGETYNVVVESQDTQYIVNATNSEGILAASALAQKTRKAPSQTVIIPVVY